MNIKHFISNLYPEYLQTLIDNSYNYSQVLSKLDVPINPTTVQLLKDRIEELKLITEHFNPRLLGAIWDLGRDEFKEIIQASESYSDALRKIGLQLTGGNLHTLKNRILSENLNVQHILLYKPKVNRPSSLPLEELLVKDSPVSSSKGLRVRLLREGLLKNKCEKCGIGPDWQGESLTLELDHIDGDNKNNELSNLRILCPNCHSQTETFGGKNIKKITPVRIYYCQECYEEVHKGSRKCVDCANKKQRKAERPPKEELLRLILTKPFTQIGKDYGVSDNAVRKWCKRYELPHTQVELQQYKKTNTHT